MHTPLVLRYKNMRNVTKRAIQVIIWMALLLFAGCERQQELEPAGTVLALVGDRVITLDDFIRRSEYTLRPDYCSGDNYIHKKIILNSLIAEKLIALDAEDSSPLDTNMAFQDYLDGRLEQTMRQLLYKKQAHETTIVDSTQHHEAFKLAGRTVNVNYYTLSDSASAYAFQQAIEGGAGFKEIYSYLYQSDSLPSREINWFDREVDVIHDVLFDPLLVRGQVLGPLYTGDGSILVMQVGGWTDSKVVTQSAVQQRWTDVGERLHTRVAGERYEAYVASIMAGKRLDLNEAVFIPYARAAADQYLSTKEEKKAALNQALWDLEEHLETNPVEAFPEVQKQEPLFSVDGVQWSVKDYESYLRKHPLVFRKRQMGRSEFPEQLKFAIADMIRDHYVTERAYELGYDQFPEVKQARALWSDSYVSRQQRLDYLLAQGDAGIDTLTQNRIFKEYLDPWVDSLQEKYDDRIEINMDLFESIEITTVPMMVSQRGVPFPLMMPSFPLLTTDDRLDYGSDMGEES